MNLTPQQIDAVTTEGRALLVEAGAGTGKTAVLVQRFVHLLERHPEWPIDSIVAVTFTEKATREMRSRIRADIEARAAAGGPNSLWEARRRDLDRLAVSTIHGLCARILRENPIAAAIDPRFTVLEEQDTALLREESVRRVVAELASEQRPTASGQRDPLELLALFETNDLREQMIRLLNQRGTAERLFAQLPGSADLMARWREKVREMQAAIWAEHLAEHEEAAEGLAELANLVVEHPEDKLAEHVGYAQEGCALADCGDICGAATAFARIKVNAGRAASFGGADRLNEVKGWLKAVRALGESLTKRGYCEPVGENDEAAADALQCWRAFWELVTHVYDGMKADLRALDFDDLERLAWRLLTARPRDERVQATVDGINHLMVDEFQDVNEMQGEILRGLADLGAAGRFFAVGDAKQSIYRFRQAQVKVFNAAARDILAQTGHGPLPLNRSFRTHAALLNALNVAFEGILAPAGAEHADFEARPGALDPERAALAPCEAAPAAVEILALTPGPADETRRDEAALLARRLRELVGQRMPVWDKEQRVLRPVTFGDMAILFRATTSLPIYEDVFKAAGLPYVTVSGRGYYDRPEVRDLTALLAWLSNPADDLSAATVLRSPMFSLSDESLYRLRWFGADGARPTRPDSLRRSARRGAHRARGMPASDGNRVRRRDDGRAAGRDGQDRRLDAPSPGARPDRLRGNACAGRRGGCSKWGRRARPRQRRQVFATGAGSRRRRPVAIPPVGARPARTGSPRRRSPARPAAGGRRPVDVGSRGKGAGVSRRGAGRPRADPARGKRRSHPARPDVRAGVPGARADGDWIKPASFRWAEWLDASDGAGGEQAPPLRRLHARRRPADPFGQPEGGRLLAQAAGRGVGGRRLAERRRPRRGRGALRAPRLRDPRRPARPAAGRRRARIRVERSLGWLGAAGRHDAAAGATAAAPARALAGCRDPHAHGAPQRAGRAANPEAGGPGDA